MHRVLQLQQEFTSLYLHTLGRNKDRPFAVQDQAGEATGHPLAGGSSEGLGSLPIPHCGQLAAHKLSRHRSQGMALPPASAGPPRLACPIAATKQ